MREAVAGGKSIRNKEYMTTHDGTGDTSTRWVKKGVMRHTPSFS